MMRRKFVSGHLLCASIFIPAEVLAKEEIIYVESTAVPSSSYATGMRTNTPIKLIPQTLHSIEAGKLSDYTQPTLSEALVGIPGVNASGDTRFDGVMIRGFNAGNDFYLDGFRDDMQYTRDLSNIERIDVLKGPAAVLYGRGNSGGIVNRISKVPRKDADSLIGLQYGSEDLRRAHADVSAAMGDSLTYRLNTAIEKKNSFRDGVHQKRSVVAPAASWQIGPGINWLLQYDYQHNHRTPDRGIPGVNGRPARVNISSVYSDMSRDYIDDTAQSLRSRLTWDANYHWQFRHLFAWNTLHSQFDNTYVTGVRGDNVQRARWVQNLHAENWLTNVEAEGLLGAGPLEHKILAGLEGNWQSRSPKLWRNSRPVPGGNLYHPEALPSYNGQMKLASHSHHQVRNGALYLQDQISLNNWTFVAGFRYDHFTVESRRLDLNLREERTVNSLSPRLGVVWSPLEEHSFYASFSKTWAPPGGGTIGITPGNKSNQLAPEHTRQYETGVKSEWLDGKLSTMLSLYRLEMYNRRMRDPNIPDIVKLAGLQRTDGMELSTELKFDKGWYLRGGIAFQNASFIEAEPQIKNKRPRNVSRQNGEFFVGYRAPGGWYGEMGVVAVGQRYADNENKTIMPGYSKTGIRAGYQWLNWDAQFSVDNLFNNTHYVSATSANQILPGSPRQLTAKISYKF
ncbi:TPA: TonB-dependent siderophore receptor [Escherichia coli]|nr:TonB-dependent siderophore receptor [Escherichia coli]